MNISKKAIDNPLKVILFTVFLIIVGLMSAMLIPIELFPEIEVPIVIVSVPYIGAAPNELENEVIRKLEEQMRKIDNVKRVRSWAVNSMATVVVEFYEGVSVDLAKTDVRNGVNDAQPDMPRDIETPVISTVDFSAIPVMTVAIYGEITDFVKLREIAEDLKSPLEAVKGVSSVSVFGGFEREIRIDLNSIKMHAYKISVDQIVSYLQQSNLNFPGGTVTSRQNEYPMRIIGRFKNVNELKKSIITFRKDPNNPYGPRRPIRLSDIAVIRDGTAEITNISRYNGRNCVSLEIRKKKKINLLNLSKRMRKALKRLEKSMLKPIGLKFAITGDQADHVKRRVTDLFNSIWQGVIAIFLVLWLGMGFRNAFIASIGIPFCLIFAIAGLFFIGSSLNNLSQFGLIIIIGMVVDGAIVVLENVYRHREMGKSKRDASIDGMDEVGTSVMASVLTTMAAFAPMLFMTGIVGQFMGHIPKAVLFALFASILFDHIFIPVLANKFMSDPVVKAKKAEIKAKRREKKKKGIFFKIKTKLKKFSNNFFNLYKKLIRWSVSHRKLTVFYTFIFFVIGVVIFMSRPKEFFSQIDIGQLYVNVELPPIASIEQTDSVLKKIEKNVLEKYYKKGLVKQYLTTVGSASQGGATTSVVRQSNKSIGMITVELIDTEDRPNFPVEKFQGIVRKYVADIPGAKFEIKLPQGGPPTGAPVNVVVQGKDIKVLKNLSRKIQNMIRTNVQGAVDIRDNYGVGIPEISARVRRRMADLHGIPIQTIARALSVTFNGYEVSKYYFGDKEIKVRVKIADKYAQTVQDLERIYFYKQSTGTMIHLTELVDVRMGSGLSVIAREDMRRSITISGNTFGRTSVEVMEDVKALMKSFPLPSGYSVVYKGENEDRDESFKTLGYAFIGGLLLIYIIIVLQLHSFIQPLSILCTILLSIVGVSFGLLISGSKVGLMAFFGIVALAGVVVNDAIVLVSYINILRKRGYDRKEAIIEACETRIRPIFMTTFTTIAGLLPLALALGGESTKFWVPMGWAIIGGLLFATLQTLIAVPIIYSVFEDLAKLSCRIVQKTVGGMKKIISKLFGVEFLTAKIKQELYGDDDKPKAKYCDIESIEKGISDLKK